MVIVAGIDSLSDSMTLIERIFPQRGIQTPTEGVDESMHALGALSHRLRGGGIRATYGR